MLLCLQRRPAAAETTQVFLISLLRVEGLIQNWSPLLFRSVSRVTLTRGFFFLLSGDIWQFVIIAETVGYFDPVWVVGERFQQKLPTTIWLRGRPLDNTDHVQTELPITGFFLLLLLFLGRNFQFSSCAGVKIMKKALLHSTARPRDCCTSALRPINGKLNQIKQINNILDDK